MHHHLGLTHVMRWFMLALTARRLDYTTSANELLNLVFYTQYTKPVAH
jgi:hypothetical protein